MRAAFLLLVVLLVTSAAQAQQTYQHLVDTLGGEIGCALGQVGSGPGGVLFTGDSRTGTRVEICKYDHDGAMVWRTGLATHLPPYSLHGTDDGGVLACLSPGLFNNDGCRVDVVKLGPDGDLQWATQIEVDHGYGAIAWTGLDQDNAGNIFVGWRMDYQGAICKLTPTGQLLWQRDIPVLAMVPDEAGGVYTSPIGNDLLHFDANGTLLWYRSYQSPCNCMISVAGLKREANGNILLSGQDNPNQVADARWRQARFNAAGELLEYILYDQLPISYPALGMTQKSIWLDDGRLVDVGYGYGNNCTMLAVNAGGGVQTLKRFTPIPAGNITKKIQVSSACSTGDGIAIYGSYFETDETLHIDHCYTTLWKQPYDLVGACLTQDAWIDTLHMPASMFTLNFPTTPAPDGGGHNIPSSLVATSMGIVPVFDLCTVTGIDDAVDAMPAISLFPSFVDDGMNVTVRGHAQRLVLLNMAGQVCGSWRSTSDITQLPTSTLASGTYVVHAMNGNGASLGSARFAVGARP